MPDLINRFSGLFGGTALPQPGPSIFNQQDLAQFQTPKKKGASVAINPGGHAGLGMTISPGGAKGLGVTSEAMNPSDAAALATKANTAVQKALAPAPDEQKSAPAADPGAPPDPGTGSNEEHGGIYKEYTHNDGTRRVFYNDGYYIVYNPDGSINKEHNYGSVDKFPSDEKLKNIKEGTKPKYERS